MVLYKGPSRIHFALSISTKLKLLEILNITFIFTTVAFKCSGIQVRLKRWIFHEYGCRQVRNDKLSMNYYRKKNGKQKFATGSGKKINKV